MVLDEASPTAESSFAEDQPSSDTDPYSVPTPANRPLTQDFTKNLPPFIDLQRLPRPIPLFGRLNGYTDPALSSLILRDARRVSELLGRPLKQAEWEACAYHSAKLQSWASYGAPLGIAAGVWRYRNTKAEFRFPFWKPDLEKTNFNRIGSLEGARVRLFWNLLRLNSYMLIGAAVGSALVGTYATTVAVTGQRVDPRLADLQEAIKRRRSNALGGTGGGELPRPMGMGAPMGGMTRPAGPQASEAENMRNAQTETIPRQQQQQYGQTQGGTTESTNMTTTQQAGDFGFDDASPTAGTERPSQASGASETAWERIRRGNAPRPQPGQAPRPLQGAQGDAWTRVRGGTEQGQQQGSTVGDGYSFSSSEEERQLAKQEAQREFDARLERERQGKEFDDPKGGWK